MPKNRTPLKKAMIMGAVSHDPGRYRNRREPSGLEPIGAPPGWMAPDQVEVWQGFTAELPWLNRSHRGILEIATVLRTRLAGGTQGVHALHLLRQCLAALGATPVDASKVAVPDDDADPDEEYFQ